nr:S8 family serine peptidase [Streptococcus catagoni]
MIAIIDGGIDEKHPVFSKEQDDKDRFKDEVTLEEEKKKQNISRGKWINHKLVFFHDYNNGLDTSGVERKDLEHGTHVAGIAAASLHKSDKNSYLMQGVAPDAQIMFLKVRTPKNPSKMQELYALAIEDALAMGASAINISLGNTAEASQELNEAILKALNDAKNKGVAIIVAAGNDGAMGGSARKPLAQHPDYGLIGTPASTDHVLTVAAYVSPSAISEVISIQSDKGNQEIATRITSAFPKDASFDLVLTETSLEELDENDLKGKVVLVDYATVSSSQKTASLAEKKGAAGLLIYNEDYKKPLLPLNYQGNFPLGFISREDFDSLKSLVGLKATFTQKQKVFAVPGGAQMTGFSTWGLTADGNFKPDIAAPGYEISSVSPADDYSTMSGTSMATPHVTGIISLVKKAIQEKYPDLSADKLLSLTKKLLMSSADPLLNPNTGTYYSPRQQGAGAVNAKRALDTEIYLTGTGDEAKVNLSNIEDQFVIKVKVHNLSKSPKVFNYHASLLRDEVKDGKFQLQSKLLLQTAEQTITLGAKEEKWVEIKADISSFSKELLDQMKNGFFVDGFVHFKEKGDQSGRASIPFIGFRGQFADLQALETPIYQSLDGTFYYQPSNGQRTEDFEVNQIKEIKENNVTGLFTHFTPWSIIEGSKSPGFEAELEEDAGSRDFLGSYAKGDGSLVRSFYFVDGQAYLSISPNGDKNMDEVTFKGAFLRNVKDIKAYVFKEGDLENPIWQSELTAYAHKQYNTNELKEGLLEQTTWYGKDQNGQTVPEGNYIYRVSYRPLSQNAKEQFTDFKIKVDLTKPALPLSASLDVETRKLTVSFPNEGDSYRHRLYYNFGTKEAPSFTVFEQTAEGVFEIPESYENELTEVTSTISFDELDKLFLVSEDRSGNYSSITLEELLKAPKVNPDSIDHENEEGQQDPEIEDKKEMPSPNEEKTSHDKEVVKSLLNQTEQKPSLSTLAQEVPQQASLPQTNSKERSGIIAALMLFISGLLFSVNSKKKKTD